MPTLLQPKDVIRTVAARYGKSQFVAVSLFVAVMSFLCTGCQPETKHFDSVIQLGHTADLGHVLFDRDGKYLLTLDRAYTPFGEAILWDLATGEKLRVFPGNPSNTLPQFCCGGDLLLIGGKLIELNSGKQLSSFVQEDETFVARTLNANQTRVAISTSRNRIKCVALPSGRLLNDWSADALFAADPSKELGKVHRRPGRIYDLQFTLDDELVALFEENQASTTTLTAWNLTQQKQLASFPLNIIDNARLSSDTQFAVTRWWDDTGHDEEETIVYDIVNAKHIYQCRELSSAPNTPLFTPDGKHCVVGTGQKSARLISLTTGEVVREFPASERSIRRMELLADGTVLQTLANDKAARWSLLDGDPVQTFVAKPPLDIGRRLSTSSNQQHLVIPFPKAGKFLCGDQIVDSTSADTLVNLTAPELLDAHLVSGGQRSLYGQYVSPDGRRVIATGGKQSWLIDAMTGKRLAQLATGREEMFDLQWNRDGRRALTRAEGVTRLWNVQDGRVLQTFGYVSTPQDQYGGPQVCFSPNGKFVCTFGRRASLWDAETGEPVADNPDLLNVPTLKRPVHWKDNKFALRDPARGQSNDYNGNSILSPNRRLCIAWTRAEEASSIDVWDLNAGKISKQLACDDMVLSRFVSVSIDGQFVSASSLFPEKTIVWDLTTGQRLHTLTAQHGQPMYRESSVSFLPNGKQLLFTDANRSLRLIEIASGETIHTLRAPKEIVDKRYADVGPIALYSPDVRYAVAVYGTEHSIVWDLTTGNAVLQIDQDTGNIPDVDRLYFSDDCKCLLATGGDFAIWDIERQTSEAVDFDFRKWRHDGEFVWKEHRFVFPSDLGSTPDNLVPCPAVLLEKFVQQSAHRGKQIRLTRDARRIIDLRNPHHIAAWDVDTGKLIANYYRFDFSREWVTMTPDGDCRGELKRVRYRRPGTVQIEVP